MPRVSKDFEDYASINDAQMEKKRVPSWMDNFKGAKKVGEVKVYAVA